MKAKEMTSDALQKQEFLPPNGVFSSEATSRSHCPLKTERGSVLASWVGLSEFKSFLLLGLILIFNLKVIMSGMFLLLYPPYIV